jgi:hypothetical protein
LKKKCCCDVSALPKNAAKDRGRPSSTRLSNPTDGLVRFCSISEIVAFETSLRFAN